MAAPEIRRVKVSLNGDIKPEAGNKGQDRAEGRVRRQTHHLGPRLRVSALCRAVWGSQTGHGHCFSRGNTLRLKLVCVPRRPSIGTLPRCSPVPRLPRTVPPTPLGFLLHPISGLGLAPTQSASRIPFSARGNLAALRPNPRPSFVLHLPSPPQGRRYNEPITAIPLSAAEGGHVQLPT